MLQYARQRARYREHAAHQAREEGTVSGMWSAGIPTAQWHKYCGVRQIY